MDYCVIYGLLWDCNLLLISYIIAVKYVYSYYHCNLVSYIYIYSNSYSILLNYSIICLLYVLLYLVYPFIYIYYIYTCTHLLLIARYQWGLGFKRIPRRGHPAGFRCLERGAQNKVFLYVN